MTSGKSAAAASARPNDYEIRKIGFDTVFQALRDGFKDFMRAPNYGVFFGSIYAAGGILLFLILTQLHMPWFILPLAVGFPLIGPFVAVGLYEISRRHASHKGLRWGEILTVILAQRKRQVGWMAFVVLFIFWIWLYQVRLLLAIFLGFKSFSTVESFINVLTTTGAGLAFLGVGTIVGAALSLILFCTTVISIPMLLDREMDMISAIIASFRAVIENPGPMLLWAAIVAALAMLALLPLFLGLLIVLPVLGHATWHLYKSTVAYPKG